MFTRLLLLSFISSSLGSFLLDMNMEMNPIAGGEEQFEQGLGKQVQQGDLCSNIHWKSRGRCSRQEKMWKKWIDERLKNSKLMAKIGREFRRSYKSGALPDSVIQKLNEKFKIGKKFKKIAILGSFDASINTSG